jgi:hypothetical protein
MDTKNSLPIGGRDKESLDGANLIELLPKQVGERGQTE